MLKVCAKCKENKSINEFYLHRRKKGKTYFMSICKNCSTIRNKEYRRKRGITGDRSKVGEANPNAKLTQFNVLEILWLYFAGGITQEKIAEKYRICRGQISAIVRRKSWKHLDKKQIETIITNGKAYYRKQWKFNRIFTEIIETEESIKKLLRNKSFLQYLKGEK